MNGVRRYSRNLYRDSLALQRIVHPISKVPAAQPVRMTAKPKEPDEELNKESEWPRRIFSGIQPTGSLHLGNYLGAVQKWTELQDARDDVTYCIVDMHAITLSHDPEVLRENIMQMAATMFACGIEPGKSTVFVQSAVMEHSELFWILNCMSTMARLGHMPQYKEKMRVLKEVPLGLFAYPVLQAADIMLHKATHVPVGEDQLQHIQLTQHLAKNFNTKFGNTFPICHAVIDNQQSARIRSLRDPNKKMSKSDPDSRATINLTDEPDEIVEKIKKAVTDFTSDVTYDPIERIGVSNLIAIHSLCSGQKIDQIVEEASTIDTGKYKARVAEAVVEHLSPIRAKIKHHMNKRHDLVYLLDVGAEKARQTAQQTMLDVKQRVGLGAVCAMPDVRHTNLEVKPLSLELNRDDVERKRSTKLPVAVKPLTAEAKEANEAKEGQAEKLPNEIKL